MSAAANASRASIPTSTSNSSTSNTNEQNFVQVPSSGLASLHTSHFSQNGGVSGEEYSHDDVCTNGQSYILHFLNCFFFKKKIFYLQFFYQFFFYTSQPRNQTNQMRRKDGLRERISTGLKKRQTELAGVCSSCRISFSGLLVKRQTCTNCGEAFCSNCANQQVTRAVLGATSPAAYSETVKVCGSCFDALTRKR